MPQTIKRQSFVHRIKGIVHRAAHETPPQSLQHHHLAALRSGENLAALPRGMLVSIVERAENARLPRDMVHHFALVEGMVAQGDTIDPRVQQRPCISRRQPPPIGGVLGVDHNEIQLPPIAQALQLLLDSLSPHAANHVP